MWLGGVSMLKRKYGDRSDWKRVLEREYAQSFLETETFKGHITLLKIVKAVEPLYVSYNDRSVCIVDDGYLWLQQFPSDKYHSVTTMFDAEGEIVQWYIDISYMNGVNSNNVPWMDDLFLDIIVLPSGELVQKDADELEEALLIGIIDNYQYNLAWEETDRIKANIKDGNFGLLRLSKDHKDVLLKKL
jgi:predicted RNA-binding protein associated with RNAse of E/G family